MSAGLTNREISDRMGVTEKTVKFHVGNILKKLNVRNRVEAALLAKRQWGEA
jgi:DNA-binding NarL/FixJ family response regulator